MSDIWLQLSAVERMLGVGTVGEGGGGGKDNDPIKMQMIPLPVATK